MLNASTPSLHEPIRRPTRYEGPIDTAERHSVLVVDDEVRIVELLKREMSRTYRVLTATSGKEALEILEQTPVTLVIADQRMPGMTGTELMEKIVEHYPEVVRILLTGYSDLDALTDAINKGQVYRYVSKPWEPEELRIIIEQSIERFTLKQENRVLIEDLKKKNAQLSTALDELQKTQKELLRAERAGTIGKMANMIIHDFKNPLTSIIGLTEMLLTSRIDNEERKNQYYHMIHKETERILRMVQEILDYVRGEGPALNREHHDLVEFMEEVCQEVTQYLMGSGIKVLMRDVSDATIFVDRENFKRVFHNLAVNARDAMNEGGTLSLSAGIEEDRVCFRVSDTGKGIPIELQERVFEPFFTTGKHNGSGLGLAIVKRIVEAHRGEIHIESSDETGTTFTVALPLF